MKVTKFLKGLLAAALAVTMAVTPATSVKAAEVTVTSGASTYTFSEMPVAAFEVTGWRDYPIILYVLPKGTTVHSQAGSSDWEGTIYADEACLAEPASYKIFYMEDGIGETLFENDGSIEGEASRFKDNIPYIRFTAIYHSDISGFDSVFALYDYKNDGSDPLSFYDLSAIPEVFALNGATAVQIPVETALAMDNANVQSSTTQTTDAQAAADAQAAQAAADAQAAAQAQAAQTQIAPQQTSVAQGTYTVEANDNLCKIAQKVYGDMKAWREIYKANSNIIKNDYVIYVGQTLTIPAR